jgi:hypothetical protein
MQSKKDNSPLLGGVSVSIGVGTINLKFHNKLTNQYDILVLEGVSHLEKAPNLISTGKLNLINMHINTVNNTLFHTQSDMHVNK